MREHQPVAQAACRFAGRRPIKRHERGADACGGYDVGALAVAGDTRNLDVVRTTIDDFVEVMHESPVSEAIVGATLRTECAGAASSF